ncbi:MAG: methyltransferase domain-containing protein [Flavobacteriales bacterium]
MDHHDHNRIRVANNVADLIGLDAACYAELGPGPGGGLAIMLKEKGRHVIAVESPWAADVNKAWARETGVPIYFEDFFVGDLSVIKEKVDCFVIAHCIAHFRFSPYLLFQQLYDRLPSGGHLFLSTVNATAYERVVEFMKGRPVVEKVRKGVQQTAVTRTWNHTELPLIWDDWMHVKEYTRAEIEEIFTQSGFHIVRSLHRNNFPGWRRAFWKKNLAIKLFPHLADEVIVIGRKP